MECVNCNSSQLVKIIDIGSQPISSVFPTEKKYDLKEYSLDVFKCEDCELIQFGSVAPLDDMYGSTYGYRTSLSGLMINHMRTKYEKIINNNILKENSLILDIGSNDGTFLNFFANNEKNFRLHGIDPSAGKFSDYYNKRILVYKGKDKMLYLACKVQQAKD